MKSKLEKWDFIFVTVSLKDKLNRDADFSFLFDTACGMTEISHKTAQKLGYSAKDGIRRTAVNIPAGKIEGFSINVNDLKVFGENHATCEVSVFDLAAVEAEGEDLDGILGMDIIGKHRLLLDGPAHIVKRMR